MMSRKKNLLKIKQAHGCEETCTERECPLRPKKPSTGQCNCHTTAQQCYFCFFHCCDNCAENKDFLETGNRRCKDEECLTRQRELDVLKCNDTKSLNASKIPQSRVIRGRCGYCKDCKNNCESEGRSHEEWCDSCRKKKDGKADKTGCKRRKNCPNKGKPGGNNYTESRQNTETEENKSKRKPEESPPGKTAPQKIRDDTDNKLEIKADTTEGRVSVEST